MPAPTLSFEAIFEAHKDMVYNLCLHYLQQAQDAEEITQDVFVKVYQKRASFQGKSSMKTWVYRIAVNQCLDFLKAQKRQKRLMMIKSIFGLEAEKMRELPDFNHPGALLEDKEALGVLFGKINQLPPQQKTAFILKYLEHLPQQEIAAVMSLSEKAVESLLQRAKQHLKKNLGPNEG